MIGAGVIYKVLSAMIIGIAGCTFNGCIGVKKIKWISGLRQAGKRMEYLETGPVNLNNEV